MFLAVVVVFFRDAEFRKWVRHQYHLNRLAYIEKERQKARRKLIEGGPVRLGKTWRKP
jgi:hypothetical protein